MMDMDSLPETPASAGWRRVRRWFALATLVGAPLAGVVWSFFVSPFSGMSNEVAFIATHNTQWMGGTLAGVLMSCLMIPAAITIARLVRPRAPIAADVGLVLFAFGAFCHGAMLGYSLTEAAIARNVADRALATTIVTQLYEHRAFTLLLTPFLTFYVGMLILTVAMLVRRIVPLWIPVAIIVGIVFEFVGPMGLRARVFFLLLLAAFAGISLVYGSRDDD